MLTMTYSGAGQNALALDTGRRMMACDPLSPLSSMAAGVPLWFVGGAEETVSHLLRGLELDYGRANCRPSGGRVADGGASHPLELALHAELMEVGGEP